MKDDSKPEKFRLLKFLSWIMTIVLILVILFILYSLISMFFLPDSEEYEGRFPTDPPLFSNKFWETLRNGILRHVALLNNHITASQLIGIVGLFFTTLLLFSIRKKVLNMSKGEKGMEIHEYVEWGFGSIISAIIYLAGNIRYRPEFVNVIFILSICAFIIYLIHPSLGLLFAIKDRIRGKIPKKK